MARLQQKRDVVDPARVPPSFWLRCRFELAYSQPVSAAFRRFRHREGHLAWVHDITLPAVRPARDLWQPCWRPALMQGPRLFSFFGVAHSVADNRAWNWTSWGEGWLHNLNAFDDLTADGAAARFTWHNELVNNWVLSNPPGQGFGWKPQNLCRRIGNWAKWGLANRGLNELAQRSLYVQTSYLRQHLGNVILQGFAVDAAKALVVAGTYFEGREADQWRQKGLKLWRRCSGTANGNAPDIPRRGQRIEDLLDLIQLSYLYPQLFPDSDIHEWAASVHGLFLKAHGEPPVRDPVAGMPETVFDNPPLSALRGYARDLDLFVPGEAPGHPLDRRSIA